MKDNLYAAFLIAIGIGSTVSFVEIIGLSSLHSALTPKTIGAGLLAAIVSYLVYSKRR